MTTRDNENENDSTEETAGDRLGEIKKEEQEDASAYYAQGKEETPDMKEEFEKPISPVEKGKEDMNLLRAVAFLGFGLAALAVIFILFFIRDLDQRVGGVDSAVNQLEDTIGPLKTEVEGSIKAVEENLKAVTQTVASLQGKLGDYEKSMAVMELKRALVMVQGISMGSDTGVQSKSTAVAASIQTLLNELGEDARPSEKPAGEIQMKEAAEEPSAPAEEKAVAAEPEEAPAEEPAAEESEETAEESAGDEGEESSAEEEGAEESEEMAEESSDEAAGDEAADETEEAGESEDHGADEQEGADKTAEVEELPTVEELLKD